MIIALMRLVASLPHNDLRVPQTWRGVAPGSGGRPTYMGRGCSSLAAAASANSADLLHKPQPITVLFTDPNQYCRLRPVRSRCSRNEDARLGKAGPTEFYLGILF